MLADLRLIRELLTLAGESSAPVELPGQYGDREFVTASGWKVVIFYDCGELDYIDHFVSPDGAVVEIWEDDPRLLIPAHHLKQGYDFTPLQCWRSVADTDRLLALVG